VNASEMISPRNRTPFEPFEIHLSVGERIRVEEPYHIATRRNRPACVVYDEDGQMRFIVYRNITQTVTAARN